MLQKSLRRSSRPQRRDSTICHQDQIEPLAKYGTKPSKRNRKNCRNNKRLNNKKKKNEKEETTLSRMRLVKLRKPN
jgi:hypothetical protein